MQSEIVETVYSLLPRKQVVYRATHNGNRIYYTVDPTGEPTLYLSLTTMIKATCPTSDHLIKWIAEMGYDAAKKYSAERADYGSLMHILFGKYIVDKFYDFDKTEEICKSFPQYKYKDEWLEELNKDVAGFMQFVVDRNVKPLAVELVLVSEDGYGTLCDLICEMDVEVDGLDHENPYKSGVRKGQPREVKQTQRITALINFKSGRKGFYETHEIQLEFERRLFEENFPEIKIGGIFNLSPTDWRTTPSYKLKDQSDSLEKEKADAILAIAKIELMKKIPTYTSISGKVTFGGLPMITSKTLMDEIREAHKVEEIFSDARP